MPIPQGLGQQGKLLWGAGSCISSPIMNMPIVTKSIWGEGCSEVGDSSSSADESG